MIGYVTIGTDNLQRSSEFYDALLAVLGAKRLMESERFIAWSTAPGESALCVLTPYNDEAASVGNGVMVALKADSPAQVDAVYAKAIALGASDEGAPGPRGDGSFYAAYFRDPDGNKLNAYHFKPAG